MSIAAAIIGVATLSHMYVLPSDWEMAPEDFDNPNPCQAIPKTPSANGSGS